VLGTYLTDKFGICVDRLEGEVVLLPHREGLRLGEGQTVERDDRDLLAFAGSLPRDERKVFGNIFVWRTFGISVFVFTIVVIVVVVIIIVVVIVVVVEVVVAEVQCDLEPNYQSYLMVTNH